jgi:hypothetical protein
LGGGGGQLFADFSFSRGVLETNPRENEGMIVIPVSLVVQTESVRSKWTSQFLHKIRFSVLIMLGPQVNVVICTPRGYVLLIQGEKTGTEMYAFFTVSNDQANTLVTIRLRNTKIVT